MDIYFYENSIIFKILILYIEFTISNFEIFSDLKNLHNNFVMKIR